MSDCIFCAIAAGEIPSVTVYEDEEVRAILDLAPGAEGHSLVLPKAHAANAAEMPEALFGHVMAVGAKIGEAQKKALGAEGYNLIQNNGEAAGQSVFHLHLHVIPRRKQDGVLGLWQPREASQDSLRETGEALRKAL
ncbi:MAG: HIT family protein [Lachnospiraceae bacterium]|nr:HIT family protein [Lachnospiraceae bacterium]